jgi:hypothetical protein
VDAPLSWFHNRNHKSNVKEKANSRFLHASYTFCMTKKDLLIGGRIDASQLLVAARQTVQCSSVVINNRVFVIKSFKMANFTSVELTDIRCGGWQRSAGQILYRGQFPGVVPNLKTFTSTVQRLRETGNFYPRMEDRDRDNIFSIYWE